MKLLFAALLLTSVSASAAPDKLVAPKTASEKICDALQNDLDDQCAHIMCDSLIKDKTFKSLADCTSASDYAEAAQASCDDVPSIDDAVSDYNHKNPAAHLTCEQ